MAKLDKDLIQATASREIASAVAHYDSDVAPDALRSQDYYRGVMLDLPAADGRSQMVSRDVRDAINMLLPGLMRVFHGSADTVRVEPRDERSIQIAKQASAKLNYEFRSNLDGYNLLYTAIHDALLMRNGIIKVWWDKTDEGEAGTATGLTEQQLAVIQNDPLIVITSGEARDDQAAGQVYDIEFKRTKPPRICAVAVPREEFLISSEAKEIDKARLVAHRQMITRGDLVEMGFDADIVDSLPTSYGLETDMLALGRTGYQGNASGLMDDATTRENEAVEYVEAYLRFDIDGDGIAERVKVCMAGGDSNYMLLQDPEEVEDAPPFVDIRAKFRPHTFEGISIADELIDVQRGKTALWRALLDNVYHVVNPQREVVESQIVDPDELLSQSIGQIVRVKTPNAVREMVVPFVGDSAIAAMTLLDDVGSRRTGISKQTAALDGKELQNQSATASMINQDAGYAQTELIARNMAHGVRKLFIRMLKIITANQNWPETIRLNGTVVDVDPRSWNAEMDVIVDIGLGTGSRERDSMMLANIGMEQDKVIAAFGPNNPWVSPRKWMHTRRKMVEVSGGVGADQYFGEVPDDKAEQWMQEKAAADKAAADAPINQVIQVETMKADTTLKKAAADASLKEQEINTRDATERYKADLEAMVRVMIEEMKITGNLISADASLKQQNEHFVGQKAAEAESRVEYDESGSPRVAEKPSVADQFAPLVDRLVAALTAPRRAVKQADGTYNSEVIS